MAYIVGLLNHEEMIELERRGWELEDAPPGLIPEDTDNPQVGQRMKMVWVDQSMFKVMDGPEWDKG